MSEFITVGLDLAKQVFSVCVMDDRGRVQGKRELRRNELPLWLAQLPGGTVVAMEACSGAHYWARVCRQHQLEPRIMAAQFVKPFRKNAAIKNDALDAEAIATAARQGNMRFVAVKTPDQQAQLSWHRVREGHKKDLLAVMNRIRGLLAEFGVIVAKGENALRCALADLDSHALPESFAALIRFQEQYWRAIEGCMNACDKRIEHSANNNEQCQRIRKIIGIGPITADAVVATVPNASDFKNGRQFAGWLGLTPSQFGTGGKVLLGRITRRGDSYLRTLLIQGARSSIERAKATPEEKSTPEQIWIRQLLCRMPQGKVRVAIANKHARQIWAMLARSEEYDPDAWLKHPMVQRPASVMG